MGAMASRITILTVDCLLNRLFRRRSKKALKLRATGLCEGNSPVTGEFPAQRTSNAENVSIWWRHHEPLASLNHIHIYRQISWNLEAVGLDVMMIVSWCYDDRSTWCIVGYFSCIVGFVRCTSYWEGISTDLWYLILIRVWLIPLSELVS